MSRQSWWIQDRSGVNDEYSYAFRYQTENSSQAIDVVNQQAAYQTSQWNTFDSRTTSRDVIGRYTTDGNRGSTTDEGKMSLSSEVVNTEQYRHNRGNLWTRGSKGRIALRFFGCAFLIALYLFICIFTTLVLYLRPPSASISNKPDINLDGAQLIDNGTNGATGVVLPLQFNISVWNPSFISATVKNVDVKIFYPLNETDFIIGNGTLQDQLIKPNARSNFSLPIDIDYSNDQDPNDGVLRDLADRCLFNSKGITLRVKLNIKASVLGFTISAPTISFSPSFPCPFDTSKIQSFLQQADIVAEDVTRESLLDVLIKTIHLVAKVL